VVDFFWLWFGEEEHENFREVLLGLLVCVALFY